MYKIFYRYIFFNIVFDRNREVWMLSVIEQITTQHHFPIKKWRISISICTDYVHVIYFRHIIVFVDTNPLFIAHNAVVSFMLELYIFSLGFLLLFLVILCTSLASTKSAYVCISPVIIAIEFGTKSSEASYKHNKNNKRRRKRTIKIKNKSKKALEVPNKNSLKATLLSNIISLASKFSLSPSTVVVCLRCMWRISNNK